MILVPHPLKPQKNSSVKTDIILHTQFDFFFWQETVIFLIAFQPLLQKSLSKTISLEPAVVGLKSPHPLLLGIGSTCRLQG